MQPDTCNVKSVLSGYSSAPTFFLKLPYQASCGVLINNID